MIRELGARCAAEQDFVGLASYLTGMGHGVELRHLRYFVAVAEEGSLTLTTRKLLVFFWPAAVSRSDERNDRSTLSCPTFTPKHNP